MKEVLIVALSQESLVGRIVLQKSICHRIIPDPF